jgi:hypothetical protein
VKALAVVVAFAATLALALGHAGMSSWIQGLYYLAAGLPLAMAMLALGRFRTRGELRARRLFVYYFILAAATAVFAWTHVEEHEAALAAREKAVEGGDLTGTERQGQLVWFHHSISRRHVLDRGTGKWRDEDEGG